MSCQCGRIRTLEKCPDKQIADLDARSLSRHFRTQEIPPDSGNVRTDRRARAGAPTSGARCVPW